MTSSIKAPSNFKPSRFWGATTLVAGTTIGAGALALPSVTSAAGLIPSSIALIFAWAYALSTGLLLVEIHLRSLEQSQTTFEEDEQTASIGLISLIAPVFGSSFFGRVAKFIASLAYGFLHYALLIAYIAQGGAILNPIFEHWNLPTETGPIAFTLALGSLLYWGKSRFIDRINTGFLVIILLSFAGLLITLGSQITATQVVTQLAYQNWAALPIAFPVMLVAIFFQNVVPVVTDQLEGNIKQIRRSLFLGSALPLVLFLLWNGVVLLSQKSGSQSLDLVNSSVLVAVFSVFAIATSFIGFVYGLLNFFSDIFLIKPGDLEVNVGLKRSLYLLILLPAIVVALFNPSIFLSALDLAGTFSISILGGLLPAWMAWQQRREFENELTTPELVPGGNWSLGAIGAIGLLVLGRVGS